MRKSITKDQSRDTGMAMVLLLLLFLQATGNRTLGWAAVAVQVVNMTWPAVFWPVAIVWLGFSRLLGAIVPKILLGVVFYGVVTPIGILRRLGGKDALKLAQFKKGNTSVMVERNHTFTALDMEKPY
jgi:polyferredoxin